MRRWTYDPDNPHHVFRLVEREDRAWYVLNMHKTMAVAHRDLGRAFSRLWRAILKEVMP